MKTCIFWLPCSMQLNFRPEQNRLWLLISGDKKYQVGLLIHLQKKYFKLLITEWMLYSKEKYISEVNHGRI